MRSSQLTERSHEDTSTSFSASVISDETALRDLEADWNRLSGSSPAPNAFMTCGWYRAWLSFQLRQNDGTQPRVVVLKSGGEVAGIVPLVRRIVSRWLRIRKLQFVSAHADYHDLVLGDDEAGLVASLVDYLADTADQWDVVDLRDMRDRGNRDLIEQELRRAGLGYLVLPEKLACPYVEVNGSAESLMKRHSGHVRRTMRKRAERAAAEGFGVRIIENPHQERGLLEKLIALDAKKHSHTLIPPFFGRFPEVFQSLIDTLGPRGWLYVALLENESDTLAFQFGFRCGEKLWDYAKAYDGSFSRLAPGTLLLPPLLDYAYANGFREYDFLRGEEPYKMEWNDGRHRQFRLVIWNRRKGSRLKKFFYYDVKETVNRYLPKRT